MKSYKRKIMVLLLTLLFVTAVPVTGLAKRTVKRRSITITKGSTYTFTIRNVKRASWKTSKKKVVRLKVKNNGRKAVFYGRKTGKARVTATTKKTKYIFNVTVKAKKRTKTYHGRVSYRMQGNGKIMVFYIKNRFSVSKKVTITTKFYNSAGAKIGTEKSTATCLGPHQETALCIQAPGNYDTFKNKMTVSSTNRNSEAGKLKLSWTKDENGVTVYVTNKAKKKLSKIKLAVVYYNSSGNEIGYQSGQADCYTKGSYDSIDFALPKDEDGNPINPSKYTIYVVDAY